MSTKDGPLLIGRGLRRTSKKLTRFRGPGLTKSSNQNHPQQDYANVLRRMEMELRETTRLEFEERERQLRAELDRARNELMARRLAAGSLTVKTLVDGRLQAQEIQAVNEAADSLAAWLQEQAIATASEIRDLKQDGQAQEAAFNRIAMTFHSDNRGAK